MGQEAEHSLVITDPSWYKKDHIQIAGATPLTAEATSNHLVKNRTVKRGAGRQRNAQIIQSGARFHDPDKRM